MARTHGRGGAGIRKTNKKGATKGSGGQRRKGLAGKGPTPKAEDRIYHAKHKAKLERDRRNSGRHQKETAEMVVGRNPVIECLHAKVPATTLYIVAGTRNDKRLSEAEFLGGDEYSIADMASYPWIGAYDKLPVDFAAFPNLKRWHEAIAARPATQRAYALRQQVNPNAGKPLSDEERKHLFGQR